MGVRPFSPHHPNAGGSFSGAGGSSFRRGREAAALLLFAMGAFLALSLLSYEADPRDSTIQGGNWAGPVGASLAAVLVRGFGIVAWLAPVELALLGAPVFRRKSLGPIGLRIAGDLIVAIIVSSLVQVATPSLLAFGAMRVGGNVGLLFGELMRGMFSTVGSFLVGGTAVGLILIGRSSFSFIAGCHRTIQLIRAVAMRFSALLGRVFGAWQLARQLRSEQNAGERARPQPIIDAKSSDEAILAQLDDHDDNWISPDATDEALPISIAPSLGQTHTVIEDDAGISETPLMTLRTVSESEANLEVFGETAARSPGSAPFDEAAEPRDCGQLAAPEGASLDDGSPAVAERIGKHRGRGQDDRTDQGSDNSRPSMPQGLPKAAHRASSDELAAVEPQPIPPRPTSSRAAVQGLADGPVIVDTKLSQRVSRSHEGPVARRRAKGTFQLPSTELLGLAGEDVPTVDKDRILEHAERLEKTLADYGVQGTVEEIHPGPTVTTYEVAPQAGTKVSKVANLADDLALGLSRKVRIIAPIPGKSRIGFELPNDERIPVNLRELVEDKRFAKLASKAPLPVVLGRDIVGAPFYADLASMPHVIVAGATGAGKSVGLNVMLSSLLFWRNPDELRLLMIDPKVVELAPFDGIPHMLHPVVTDMKLAAVALRWAVDEMERRYQLFATAGTKNILTFNHWVERVQRGELPIPEPSEVEALTADGAVIALPASKDGVDGISLPGKLPHIVIVVDEFADLMMQQGKEVEASVARLAQKARAAGMHVVLATQRPSVDVITGMIKANFPTRIAFRVAQKVDSRTILDEQGAEVLLGRGDMLVKLNGASDTRRVQCPFISEEEVALLTDYLRTQGTPQYHDAILQAAEDDGAGPDSEDAKLDSRFDEAVQIVAETQRCSTSWLQRKMTIGYNRAAKIVELMEKKGMVGPPNGAKDREIYLHSQ